MKSLRRWEPGAVRLHWNGNDLMELVLDIHDLANSRKWKVGGASKKSLFADLAEIAQLANSIFWGNRPDRRLTVDELREAAKEARLRYEK